MATNVLTYHNDTGVTGQDLTEITLTPANVNASQFLHRSAEPAALNTWPAFLQSGGTVQQLEAKIVGSNEYFQAHGGNNAGFLAGLYFVGSQEYFDNL
jgi:hypothetical protein